MSHIADRFVVVLDANVLFPFTKRDALLRFAEAGLFRARWSSEILDEWTRNLLKLKPDLRESVESQIAAMAEAFPEACVDGGQDLVEGLVLPDPGDRHVLATAIVVGAEQIVTDNLKDFPLETLEEYGLSAVSADDFLASTFELYEAEALKAMRRMRRAYTNPPYQPDGFILHLQTNGLPKLAAMLKPHIESL
ncbi:PIN domain-containing protein [Alteriqipengyuania sp. NZ-12B]|uniref:PIN domain-containing protein n=1 Tax=Alteriqipengyuania abyssalis TaxID=2860200 RepID=A0ABS7PFU6_9SPHN|nr:PIN domain-containing protein [Alteriqipengyuania abyssalis]MBY8337925.1 PIN domain-containing protein [Alteriqipengyuania abyssalis]